MVLPAEVVKTRALGFPLCRLPLDLTVLLTARSCGVQELELSLLHPRGVPTRLMIGLFAPTRDIQHLLDPARHRLESTDPAGPVEQLELKAEHLKSGGQEEGGKDGGSSVHTAGTRRGAGRGVGARPQAGMGLALCTAG